MSRSAREQALVLLRDGHSVSADRLMAQHVAAIGQQYGDTSPQFADAMFDHAVVLVSMHDLVSACDKLRSACHIPANDSAHVKARLTYIMNLGDVLQRIGKLEEAEQWLRLGKMERESFYGKTHAGYAFGLEPLASVLMKKGCYVEAKKLADEVVQIFICEQHPRLPDALALRTFVTKAADASSPSAFNYINTLSTKQFAEYFRQVLEATSHNEPRVSLTVLLALRDFCRDNKRTSQYINTLASITNVARAAGDLSARCAAFDELVTFLQEHGSTVEQMVEVLQGQAIALSESGDVSGAEKCYLNAMRAARQRIPSIVDAEAVRDVGRIVANIVENPTDAKYRSINAEGKVFSRLRLLPNVFDFLQCAGFEVQGSKLVYNGDADQLNAHWVHATTTAASEPPPKITFTTLMAAIRRNYGLLLSEQQRRPEARELLTQAVSEARIGNSKKILGEALIALGIFVQHDKELDAAKTLLEEAMTVLDPADVNLLYARSHLNAIFEHKECGCGDMSASVSQAVNEIAFKQLPAGLVDTIDVALVDGEMKVNVKWLREPVGDEEQIADRAIRQAVLEVTNSIKGMNSQ